MLSNLSIQNFLVINRVDIEFDGALNIITGETGCGQNCHYRCIKTIVG